MELTANHEGDKWTPSGVELRDARGVAHRLFRNGATRENMAELEKLQYEFFYLRHQGIRFDLRILGRTIRSVMGGQGAGR